MWGKRIQETISERPDEEDCESFDKRTISHRNEFSNRKSLTKIEKILDDQKNESNEIKFLKNKSKQSKLKEEVEKNNLYIDTENKSTKVESAERNSKEKVSHKFNLG
jgi:hypothetical protein